MTLQDLAEDVALGGRQREEQSAGQPVRFEKVEPEDEQILPPRERELDGVPSGLERKRGT